MRDGGLQKGLQFNAAEKIFSWIPGFPGIQPFLFI